MKKINDCFTENSGLYYFSDCNGFALLHLNTVEINVYYYDFEQKFSSNINIKFKFIAIEKLNFAAGVFGL